MGIEVIIGGIISILVVVIPALILYLKRKRSTRDALAEVEVTEMDASLDALERMQRPPKTP